MLHGTYNVKSTISVRNPTINFNALCNSCAKNASCSCELIMSLYSGSSFQNASEQFVSCIQLSFLPELLIRLLKRNSNNSPMSVNISNYTHVQMNFCSHNCRYCHLPKYWPFLQNHPVYNGRGANPFHVHIYG